MHSIEILQAFRTLWSGVKLPVFCYIHPPVLPPLYSGSLNQGEGLIGDYRQTKTVAKVFPPLNLTENLRAYKSPLCCPAMIPATPPAATLYLWVAVTRCPHLSFKIKCGWELQDVANFWAASLHCLSFKTGYWK